MKNIFKHVEFNSELHAGERLQFFPHAEGYVKVSANQAHTLSMFSYVFNYTDHLGNVRLSYTKDPQTGALDILDEDHYYPFGLRHGVYSAANLKDFTLKAGIDTPILEQVRKTEYQYKYNGKEWQEELNLNVYAFGFRDYDPALGRWNVVDPHAENYYNISPYAYVANNPLRYIDPDGRDIVIPTSLKGSERRQIMRQLNKLTNDRLSYDKSTGQVTISRTGSGNKVQGTELISRLVGASETITIDYQNSLGRFSDGVGNKAQADDYTKAGDGTGSGGVVSFDPDSKIKPLTENPKTGNAEEKSRPKRIGLGHELIHGLHYVDGDWSPRTDQTTHSYTDENGNTQTQPVRTEEARTVGVGGNKPGDITENGLRKENNQNKRVAY